MKLPTEKILILFMAWSIYIISLIFVGFCIFIPLPESGVDNSKYAVGFILGSCISTIITYYFGSSKGSEKKSESIDIMMNKEKIKNGGKENECD